MSVRERSFAVEDRSAAVEVRNPAGTVAVTAVAGAERVEVRVEALDELARDLLEDVEIDASPSGGTLAVVVVVPQRWLFGTPRFAVAVTVPAGADARVAVASADVGLDGPLRRVAVTAASGDVVVAHAAELQARSASGDVRAGTVDGRAVVGTASGDVAVQRAADGLQVRTASGDVTVGRADGEISVGTASGAVGIEAVAHGHVRLRTVSGDATVAVSPGQRVWLELSTVSGRMRSDLDEDAADSPAGPPTVSVSARTVSGDVRIGRAAATAAG